MMRKVTSYPYTLPKVNAELKLEWNFPTISSCPWTPAAEQPLALILSSYQAMLHAHENAPIVLDGLNELPSPLQTTILKLLRREPLRSFFQLLDAPATDLPTGRLPHVFVPAVLQSVAAD